MTPATKEDVETFHFAAWGWDITLIRSMLDSAKTPPQQVMIPIADVACMLESDPLDSPDGRTTVPLFGVDVRWDHVDELPEEALESPLFVAPLGELGNMVIDGWHRIAKARRVGRAELPGVLLTRRQAQRALLPRSAKLPPEMKEG